jgi:hypothetical protein
LCALSSLGCQSELFTNYGHESGPLARQSVNGVSVLGDMFRARGHEVSSSSWLSPGVGRRADVLVWAPNDFESPSPQVRAWIDRWLWEEEGRVMVFIGRDFDAAPGYWREMLSTAPPEMKSTIKSRLENAESMQQWMRKQLVYDEDREWFTTEGKNPLAAPPKLKGTDDWLRGIDPAKVKLELESRLTPPDDAEVLLAWGDDPFVSRQRHEYSGSIIVVANGSFLLNLPLVDHQNRRLAGKLIDEVEYDSPEGRVVFLESDFRGLPVYDKDPTDRAQTALDIVAVDPLGSIFLQLSFLGLVFCFARWPIFGRARPLEVPPTSDFGEHVSALGDLLERTDAATYAQERLSHYQQTIRTDAGGAARHRRGRRPR